MSIRIIKNTKTEPEEITCPACNSLLSYFYSDIQRSEEIDIFFNRKGVRRYIVCPVCKNDIELKTIIGVDIGKSDDVDASRN